MLRSILLVDDHFAVREGLQRLLENVFPSLKVFTAEEPAQALSLAAAHPLDVAVVDLSLPGPGGLDLVTRLKALSPRLSVLVYSVQPEEIFGIRALRAGADGYLTKDRPAEEFLEAVRRLGDGRRYISQQLAENLADIVTSPASQSPQKLLSDRELQVLVGLASGRTPTELAAALHLSIKTVSTYRARLLEKLHLGTTADLIRYAIENNLISH